MSFAPFERFLRDTIGLDAQSIGTSAIELAVLQRQASCGLPDLQAYWQHLCLSEGERQALIEAVVVPETWFFRDGDAFAALGGLALGMRASAPDRPAVRVLSVPCATGEEPYSMAMTLTDAGMSPTGFHIDAVDVSERALARARRGSYGNGSFRTEDLAFRGRYFEAAGGRYEVLPFLRGLVQFHHGNLFTPGFLSDGARYDIIWCRNVLIYFDRPTQDVAIGILSRLLKDDGFLFVGPSETAVLSQHAFRSAKLAMAFAFRKIPPAAVAAPERMLAMPGTPPSAASRVVRVPSALRPLARITTPWTPSMPSPVTLSAGTPQTLDEAQRLADHGRFVEAIERCQEHLLQNGPSAKALYLLALVQDASGKRAEAEQHYRKALYLDPNHHEALTQLVLLLDRQGHQPQAEVLRRRMGRLRGKIDA